MLTLVLYCRLFFEFAAVAPGSHTRTGPVINVDDSAADEIPSGVLPIRCR